MKQQKVLSKAEEKAEDVKREVRRLNNRERKLVSKQNRTNASLRHLRARREYLLNQLPASAVEEKVIKRLKD